VAALLITGGVVTIAGSALASDRGGGRGGGHGLFSAFSRSDDSEGSDDSDSGDERSSGDDSGGRDSRDGREQRQGRDGGDGQEDNGRSRNRGRDGNADGDGGDDQGGGGQGGGGQQGGDDKKKNQADQQFKGRDKIRPAGRDDYVDINSVEDNGGNIGDGGRFSGGSYTVDCGVSDHNNSDNYMAAPGKRNGAQHVHDYVGNQTTNANSDDNSLQDAADRGRTTCRNGDGSTFFWPVLRDLDGPSPDEGRDGGSLDGNEGSILKPRSAQLTFHGHGSQQTLADMKALPTHLMMIMGNAKAKVQKGENANAKYTCTGHEQQVTDKYPICGAGSHLVRILDYPSCWDGENLESADLRSHMAYPDEQGDCSDGFEPVPALRITLTYDQPAGRAFSIDSFPDNQHDPSTDHSDYENFARQDLNDAGLTCIQQGQECTNPRA
jgi:hypothetical protein